MNKFMTKIVGACLGLAMAVGTGVAVAAGVKEAVPVHATSYTDTWTATSGAIAAQTSGTIENGDHDWSFTRSSVVYTGFSSSCIQLGSKSGAEELTLTNSSYSGTITEVSVECSSYSGAHKIAISVGGTSYLASTATPSWTTVSAKSGTGSSSGTIEITFDSGSRALYIKSITVKYDVSSGKTDTTTTITAAGNKTTLDVSASPADSVVLTPTISYTGGTVSSSVSWTSSDPTVATVSAATGTTTTVTAFAKGTTTITASYAGDSTYEASTGTILITVTNPNEKSYSLKFDDGIIDSTGWTNSYAAHNGYTYSETGIGTLTFNFAAASKQTSNITDYPVGKTGAVEMVLSSTNYYIKDVTFNGVQWTTKTQTMTINYSTNGGTSYTASDASSSTFTVSKSGLTVGTNAIKITFSADNQVGHKGFDVVYAEKPILSSVTSSGQTTSFDYGDSFDYGGTLTAHYTAGKADAIVTPTAYKYGDSGINPDSAGTTITLGTTLTDSTHNGKYIYVGYTEDGVTKWATGYQIAVGEAPSYYMTLSVSTDTGTDYGYKGDVVTVEVTASNLAGNINWTVTAGSVTDSTYDNTCYMATITSVGTLTITATDSGDNTNTHFVSITTVDRLNAINAANETAHTSELTFEGKYSADGELVDGVASDIWEVTSDGTESTYDSTNGIHYGTNSASVQYVQLSTSSVATGANDVIKSIVVNTQDRATSKGSLTVSVGGVAFKHEGSTSVTVTGVAADYTFTGNGSGQIIVKIDRGSAATKAIYVKSVTVNYVTENGTTNIANAANMHLAQKTVIDYAKEFNYRLEAICVAYGSTDTADLTSAWSDLADQYDNWFNNGDVDLTAEEIAYAKSLFANADSVDRNKTASADDLQHMLAKYDWIVSHYEVNDFLADDSGTNRPIVQNSSGRTGLFGNTDSSNVTAIIVVVSLVSLTAIGGYFFLRKRKEQ